MENENSNKVQNVESHKIEDLLSEDARPLNSILPSGLKGIVLLSTLLVLILLTAIFLIPVPKSTKIPLSAWSTGQSMLLQYSTPVEVVDYYVTIGDTLEPGSRLVALHSDFISELASASGRMKNELQTFQDFSLPRIEVEINNLTNKAEEREILLSQIQNEVQEIEYYQDIALGTLDSMILTADKQYQRVASLNEFEVASDQELENSSNQLLQSKAEKNSITSEYIFQKTGLLNQLWDIKREVADLRKEILLKRSKALEEERKLQDKWNDLRSRVELYFGKGATIENDRLIIPVQTSGVVTYLSMKRSMHAANEIVARIAYGDDAIKFIADVDQDVYSFIRVGERVSINMEAFPHYRYGKITGKVNRISISDDQTDRYAVEITELDLGQYAGQLIPGYIGEATVFSDSYTVFQYFKQSFKKLVPLG
ncbi:MAG: hypothetical protein RIF33_07860 [Cyclobacteriaceae bacterium]